MTEEQQHTLALILASMDVETRCEIISAINNSNDDQKSILAKLLGDI